MKADQYGTPSEQCRHQAGWRNSEKGSGRCDGCEHVALDAGGNGKTTAHCNHLDLATKGNAVCDWHEPIPMPKHLGPAMGTPKPNSPEANGWRIECAVYLMSCACCAHLGRADNPNKCALTGFVTAPTSTCNRHDYASEIDMTQPKQPLDDLPTVGEMIEATTPDKALPTLKSTGTDIEVYDQRRIVNECRFYMSQSAEALLEAGRRLILMKKHEGHGEFERIVEQELGLPARTAQRMMATALKFDSPALAAKAPTLALLGKSKLFELLTEDDADLAELADGGTLAGKTLDEIDRMSVRELKAALRKEKEDARQREENRVVSGV